MEIAVKYLERIKFIILNHFCVLFLKLGDFWQDLYADEVLKYCIGPISILSILTLVPAFLAILLFITEKHIK